ncbi:MAG: GAF domain-containing protein [Actinomycetota bacterium]
MATLDATGRPPEDTPPPGQELGPADLRALVETAQALAGEVRLDRLLDLVLERAGALTGSPDASVLLYSPEKGGLSFVAVAGANASALLERWGPDSDQCVPLVGSMAGEVFTSGRPLVVGAVEGVDGHFKGVDSDTGQSTASMVCAPLAVGGQRLGVVQLLNKAGGGYDGRDLALLEHFTAHAAVALRNVQLYDDLLAHMGLYGSRRAGLGPAELLEELRRPPLNEELSVLFADMRGFTRLSQVVDRPEQTFDRLNEFLSLLARSVLAHGGLVNKFLGDGLMALFRGEGHSERAVRSAMAIVEGFDGLRGRWDETSNTLLDFVDVGVGVTTDTVLLGTLGTDRVRDFTAVGTAVALAACLMEHARDGQRLLVDRRTFRLARAVIEDFEGPETIELRSPGQEVGWLFERYSLGPPAPTRRAAPGPSGAPTADVFVSYSHRDRPWLELLRTHLKPYMTAGGMTVWDDTAIAAGARWREEIEGALNAARVAVLLVSPNFLDSDFIADNELPPLLDAARTRGRTVLWVPVSASSYDETPIAAYQATWDPGRPLDGLTRAEQNEALVRISKKVKQAVTESRARRP